jgi:hypothetical protein
MHRTRPPKPGVKELQQGGFDMKKLSIVGSDIHKDEHVVSYYNAGDRMILIQRKQPGGCLI